MPGFFFFYFFFNRSLISAHHAQQKIIDNPPGVEIRPRPTCEIKSSSDVTEHPANTFLISSDLNIIADV